MRPSVVLPNRWVSGRSTEELQTVLAHEVAHVQNGDLGWLALGRLLLVLVWAQPLYWLLRRSLRLDQEALADAAAAEHSDRRQYAEQLVAWAHGVSARPRLVLPAAMGLWEGPSQLRRRVALLLDERLTMLRQCPRVWQLSAIALVVALAALLSVATLEPMNIAKAEQSDTATAAETQHTVSGTGTTVTFVEGNPPTPWAYKPNVLAYDVQDDAGKPIEGVEAIVYRWSTRTGERKLVKRAMTDQRGAVEFAGLVAPERAAAFHELAAKSEFPSQLREVFYTVLRGEGLATVILPVSDFQLAGAGMKRRVRMRPAAELSGRVTDRDGKPVAGATVAAGSIAGVFVLDGINAVKTDADGRYRFADRVAFTREAANKRIAERNQWAMAADRDISKLYPAVFDPAEDTGTSDLYVTHPDYAVTTVRGGDVPGETDVVMAPAAAIQGRVVEFATGKPAAGVQVKASGAPTTPEAEERSDVHADDGARLYLDTLHTASTRTDEEGRYRLANLPVGKYDVWGQPASDDSGKSEWVCRGVTGVKAEAGDRPTETPDLIIGPGGTIRGQLVNAASSKPISFEVDGASLKAVSYLPDGPNQQSTLVQTVPVTRDGKFEAHALPGKSRMFVIVNLSRGEGNPQGDYRSDDGTFQSGPVFDLRHGQSIDANFAVWPRAELEANRSKLMAAAAEVESARGLINDGHYQAAIEKLDPLIKENPNLMNAWMVRAEAHEKMGHFPQLVAEYEELLQLKPGVPTNFIVRNNLAVLLATAADEHLRDGRRAVQLAEEAITIAGRPIPDLYDTLAMAYAEAGDFDKAVAAQRKAMELVSAQQRKEMQTRLEMYEAKQPYHQAVEEVEGKK